MFCDLIHIFSLTSYEEASLKAVKLSQSKMRYPNLWSLPVYTILFHAKLLILIPTKIALTLSSSLSTQFVPCQTWRISDKLGIGADTIHCSFPDRLCTWQMEKTQFWTDSWFNAYTQRERLAKMFTESWHWSNLRHLPVTQQRQPVVLNIGQIGPQTYYILI